MKSVAILLVCIYALSAEGAPTFSETFNATASTYTSTRLIAHAQSFGCTPTSHAHAIFFLELVLPFPSSC